MVDIMRGFRSEYYYFYKKESVPVKAQQHTNTINKQKQKTKWMEGTDATGMIVGFSS